MPDEHQFKDAYTKFSHGYAATITALCADDETASGDFAAAIELEPDDWLSAIPGCWHCTWLARGGNFILARSDAQKNAAFWHEKGLNGLSFALATKALVERLAWAADDPHRPELVLIAGYADLAFDTGRRSGPEWRDYHQGHDHLYRSDC